MLYRTPQETATGIAFLLKRSNLTRARVSEKTIRIMAKRKRLRSAFIVAVTSSLTDFGWSVCEIESGGFGAIQTKALEAAKTVSITRLLTEDERQALKLRDFDFTPWEAEVRLEESEPDEID